LLSSPTFLYPSFPSSIDCIRVSLNLFQILDHPLFLGSPFDICFVKRFVHGIAQPGWIETGSRRALDADSHLGSIGFVRQVRDGRNPVEQPAGLRGMLSLKFLSVIPG
jgi:hypothetical protein